MALIADYAITPDVFDTTCHSNEEVCGLHLEGLKDVLLDEGLVRDLRSGGWRALFADTTRTWHRRGKELIKKLVAQGRLVEFEAVASNVPSSVIEWCTEALDTGAVSPFIGGVVVTDKVKAAFASETLVGQIDKLAGAPWWAARSPSVRLIRRLPDYMTNLEPILRCANSIMFIDPHLDPARTSYRDFADLIVAANAAMPPTLELHRVCYDGSGAARTLPPMTEIEARFRNALDAPLRAAGLKASVFVWDDFHDRYLISNLIGISVPNGFDTTKNPAAMTTWTRMGR